ncbi:putative WW domain-containing protein [Phytophthora infestans]|uniref:Putative WW domain-containing protein n=1 Tax=Phytophthora infestans TaxID=4787 RepID=A0A833T0C3_PHYIN|nr:putative WW domain-containing protein [Phytophthora infestans]
MDTSSPEFQEALRDHARSLGVDPDSESYLLSLVQEALLAELPPDWEQGETEDGTLYYFNSSTEESIWEHPLDAHYRELIQLRKDEHAAQVASQPTETIPEAHTETIDTKSSSNAPAVTNNVDVYSFDDISDEETPAPVTSALVSNKSRISDLFSTPTQSTPSWKTGNSTNASVDSTSTVAQSTPVATGFGFGRDRSWLLDNDDDVVPVAIKPLSTTLLKQETAASNAADASLSRLEPFTSQRPGSAASTTVIPTAAIAPLSSSHTTQQDSRWSSKQSTTTTTSASSPTTTAKLQQLETKLDDANSELERERVAHSETTKNLQIAQQEAKESNYLKMKVNELKTKLSEQETAASTMERQHLDKLAQQDSAVSAREKQLGDKLAKLEAENTRLVKQQGQTQSQQMEVQQKEAQQNREALESKQTELDRLQKRLAEQEQQSKTASEIFEKTKTELQGKLDQQLSSTETLNRQHATEVAALRDQLEKVALENRILKSTLDEQTKKCQQLEILQQESGDQASKSLQFDKVQQELRMLQITADEQAGKCQQLNIVQEALTKQEKITQEMEEKKRVLQTQVDRLERESTEMSRKHDVLSQDLEAKKVENTTLQVALNRTQDELRRAQEELRKAQEETRTINSSFEQQKHQQQLATDRERITADAEAQAQSRIQRLQTQLNVQLDEQAGAKTRLQSEVIELRGELASVQAQQVKPLEKQRDQLQREVDRLAERVPTLEKELRIAKQELSTQTDRTNQLELEVDVLVRREQQRKAQTDALTTAKHTVEKQLAALQDELLSAQHDKRVDSDKLSFRVRELESQVTQKDYEAARLEERFAKAEAWRAKEAARVEKRDAQLMELREQLTAIQARHVEVETSAEIQELRAAKQKAELALQKLERELSDERDARKRDEIRRTEELQRMQQAVEWQLPQLAQACVTRSSDEWARKCRAVAKKLRDELSMRALQERNELVAREHQAHEACERAQQKLKTAVAESDFLRREVGRLEDNNKVLLEQLHTIRVYLMQRPMPTQVSGVSWTQPPSNPMPPSGATVPINFSDLSTVNQLNTQLGVLHAQFQQLFDSNERRQSFSPSDRFEIPGSPIGRAPGTPKQSLNDQMKRKEEEEEAETERIAMEALMDQKIATGNSPSPFQRQQEELLTTLESLGGSNPRWMPVYQSPAHGPLMDEDSGDQEPHSTLWYQQDYWRSKYQ